MKADDQTCLWCCIKIDPGRHGFLWRVAADVLPCYCSGGVRR